MLLFLDHLRDIHARNWNGSNLRCFHGPWQIHSGSSLTCKAQWKNLNHVVHTCFLANVGKCIIPGMSIALSVQVCVYICRPILGMGFVTTNFAESAPATAGRYVDISFLKFEHDLTILFPFLPPVIG